MDKGYDSSSTALISKDQPNVKRRMKFLFVALGALVVLISLIFFIVFLVAETGPPRPKNLIFMVADGFGPSSATLARVLSGRTLVFDEWLVGMSRTYSNDSRVTDSAAGATAWSCGLKTQNNRVAVDSNLKACGTILEAAKAQNMKVGLVSTSEVTHATPASFSAHAESRNEKEFIAKQQIQLKMDVQFGGGYNVFKDNNESLLKTAQLEGINIITTVEEFSGPLTMPVLGLFAPEQMSYNIDRDPSLEPSLAQMTEKALDLLNNDNKNGFFVMIEGSRIDMAAHSNDIAAHYGDILAFDEAVEIALKFAAKDRHTIVVITADHETGGLGLGIDNIYNFDPNNLVPKIGKSTEFMVNLLGNNFSNAGNTLAPIIKEYTSIDINQIESQLITDACSLGSYQCINAVGQVISKRVIIGWTTNGHTGVDVNLYVYGKEAFRKLFIGVQENTDIGNRLIDLFDLNVDAITEKLKDFVPHPI
eukprot:TRINITY_DN2822_c0_g1_i1.p1 TRINITY_DN2822_c0_g1~~TRINITY_DN2822_c0_g1_i1.p1  ORF type:complete len:477 (-),score=92.47 TRINITY_DN2822_c0_g1_i1:19-1449(-)